MSAGVSDVLLSQCAALKPLETAMKLWCTSYQPIRVKSMADQLLVFNCGESVTLFGCMCVD